MFTLDTSSLQTCHFRFTSLRHVFHADGQTRSALNANATVHTFNSKTYVKNTIKGFAELKGGVVQI